MNADEILQRLEKHQVQTKWGVITSGSETTAEELAQNRRIAIEEAREYRASHGLK